jgi:outer membrane receptor protein involved in Fe transport
MDTPSKFSITPITAAVTAALYPGYTVIAQEEAGSDSFLDEIIVTSRKRSESVQEIPATIQAISNESLAAMGAKGMEDYSRFVPSVNVVTYGPGSSTVVFRGAITGGGYIGQATSSIYLDEISVTQTGSQPNIRPVDIARVEALSGPQGTLYGSDAQAGTMRIITNKPEMNKFEAIFDSEIRGGEHSDMSSRTSLVFNIPLVEDELAMRIVGFNDRDGGFIDNVYGKTGNFHGLDGNNIAPAGFGTLDNSLSVEDGWNDNAAWGGRIHLRWEMSDSWATTFSFHKQVMDSGASNFMDPYVGDLEVVRFHDNSRYEDFTMGSITVEGDLGFAQLVASASYFERQMGGLYDITTYAHYWAAAYCHDSYYTQAYAPYYWANPETGYILWWPRYCLGTTVDADFFSSYDTRHRPSEDDKFTFEARLQSQGDTFDWILGIYTEESKDSWVAEFNAPTLGGDGTTYMFNESMSARYYEFYFSRYYGTPTTFPNSRVSWFSQSQTDWEQSAIYGETTWHINDDWSLTAGLRYFDRSNTNWYLVNHPGAFNQNLPGQPYRSAPWGEPDMGADREAVVANGGVPHGRTGAEDQLIPKISLRYNLNDQQMVYALYTQGKRQGGVNRSRGDPFFPNAYDSDIMDNYEIGYKSTFGDGRGRFNAVYYNMIWSDYQLNMVDPSSQSCLGPDGEPDSSLTIPNVCGQPWQAVIANAGKAHINGLNVELDYAFNDEWIFGMNYEYMEAETDTDHDLNGNGTMDLVSGMRLPLVPEGVGSMWLEYNTPTELLGADEMFVRTQWSWQGDSLNKLEPDSPLTDTNPQFTNKAFMLGDLRMGLVGEDWQLDVFVNNITDERGENNASFHQMAWGVSQTEEGRAHHQNWYIVRPREFGMRYMKRWGE